MCAEEQADQRFHFILNLVLGHFHSLPTFHFVCFYSLQSLCFTNPLSLYIALLTAMTAHATTQLHTQLPLVSLNNKTRKTTIHMVQRHFRTALTLCTLSSSRPNHHVPCQCGGWLDRVEVYFFYV